MIQTQKILPPKESVKLCLQVSILATMVKVNLGIKHEHFLGALEALDKVEGVERIRISSIEPNLLQDETIEFVSQSQRFVPHFHIPLQSGSDQILNKMKRQYLWFIQGAC